MIICITNAISDTLERSQPLKLPFCFSIQFLHCKIKRSARPSSYYANSSATCQLLLCGGVLLQILACAQIQQRFLRPSVQYAKKKTVRKNQYSAVCQICNDQPHVKCTELDLTKVKRQQTRNQLIVKNWTCSRCLLSMLPFHSVRSIDKPHEGINQNDPTLPEAANEYLEALTSHPNQLRLVHINTQSMVSSCDELVLLIRVPV